MPSRAPPTLEVLRGQLLHFNRVLTGPCWTSFKKVLWLWLLIGPIPCMTSPGMTNRQRHQVQTWQGDKTSFLISPSTPHKNTITKEDYDDVILHPCKQACLPACLLARIWQITEFLKRRNSKAVFVNHDQIKQIQALLNHICDPKIHQSSCNRMPRNKNKKTEAR